MYSVWNGENEILNRHDDTLHSRVKIISQLLNSTIFCIKCYRYEIFRIYVELAQNSGQMFPLVLSYIFNDSQTMNYTR